MAPPNPPLFRLPPDSNPSAPPFSPPSRNVPSNGLFSAASTPIAPQRSSNTPATLFAGATPGVKFNQNGKASSGLFGIESPDSTPRFSLGGRRRTTANSPLSGARRGAQSRARGKFVSPTDGDDEELIFEDDTGDEDTTQQETYDMEDTIDGYGDESDDDADESYDLLQSRHTNGEHGASVLGAESVIKPGIVTEPGSLIIRTEELMEQLSQLMAPRAAADYDSDTDDDLDMEIDRPVPPPPEKRQEHLTRYSKLFLETLAHHLPKGDPKSSLHKAYHIASLILPLHHSRANVPETLRKWLYTHKQNPTRAQLHTLKSFHPNCVCAPNYWDILQALILRGELVEALEIIRQSDWDELCIDTPTPKPPKLGAPPQKPGIEKRYSRAEIDAVKAAITVFTRLLKTCPGLARSSYASTPSSGGFFPRSPAATSHGSLANWRIWQGSVYAACDELRVPGAEDTSLDDTDDSYYADYHPRNAAGSFGVRGRPQSVQLPPDIARGLRVLYELMRGERDAVVAAATRWEDAVCALVFWNVVPDSGEEDEEEEEEEDEDGDDAPPAVTVVERAGRDKELLRLARIAESVAGGDMPLDPTSDGELAIGAVMVWDTGVVVEMLPAHSLLVAAAVVETCGWAGKIERLRLAEQEGERTRRRGGMLVGFDDDEMAVLGMQAGMGEGGRLADGVLREYACGLCALEWVDEAAEFEGWEAGVGVLERVRGGRELAGKLLTQLELTSKARVEKLLTYCNENSLTEEAADIAASFASHLSSTTSHGDALHFYSLSPYHRTHIHTLTTQLLTLSLLSSSASPSTPDPTLAALLLSPTATPSPVLRFELSGYAALRNFYTLRDTGDYPRALTALVATIKSAGERFDGGIVDPDWECAVEDWTLGALLGELLPFLDGRATGGLRMQLRECCDVMKVLTDFEIVAGECGRCADEFFARVIAAKGSAGSSEGVGGGVGMAPGGTWEQVKAAIDSGELAPEQVWRRWDWREGFRGGVKDVVAVVRLRLSREVARAWLEGEE